MRVFWTNLNRLLRNQAGQSLVEYAMVIGMVVVGVFTWLGLMGLQEFQLISGALQTVGITSP